jgi:hypothetical protein
MEPLPWYRYVVPFVGVLALAALCVRSSNPRYRAMLLGVAAMSGYGMLMDQVSARLCPEYFTVLHNPIPGLTDPTLLGVVWGFVGACWGGAIMGYAAGVTATAGRKPPLSVRELVRPMLAVVAGIAVTTAVTGASADRHAEMFSIRLDPSWDEFVPPQRHRAVFVVACYHFAAYVAAVVGGVVLCAWVARERSRRAVRPGG